MFFSKNFDRFSHVIQYGELDGLLIKPINTQFALSFWYISYHSIVRVLLSVFYTGFALSLAHISVNVESIALFLFAGLFGIIILYAVWYLVMTLIIWFPDVYNMVELLFAVDTLSRYPPQVLWTMRVAAFFIFFPMTLIVSVPTKVLLHTVTAVDMTILMGFAVVLFYLSKIFWLFALRYYTSASA